MATQWFIKPLGSYISANEEIARILVKLGLALESETYGISDTTGYAHVGMYEVPHQLIQMLDDDKIRFGFRYRIFTREINHGPVREWKFAKAKSAKTKRALHELKRIQERRKVRAG